MPGVGKNESWSMLLLGKQNMDELWACKTVAAHVHDVLLRGGVAQLSEGASLMQ